MGKYAFEARCHMRMKVQRLGRYHREGAKPTTFKKFQTFKQFKTMVGLLDGLNDLNGLNCCA